MRVKLKPAAAAAAATFLLLLLFNLTWPGHGVWLLIVGILMGLSGAYLWWRDRFLASQDSPNNVAGSPFADVGAYGLAGTAVRTSRQTASGVPLSGVLAPVAALALLLFIGGTIGSAEPQVQETSSTLEQNVSVIDRSRDGEPVTPQVDPPSAVGVRETETATTSSTVTPPQTSATSQQASTGDQQSSAPVKPIVVAAPTAASPSQDEPEAVAFVPESANTFEYIVEEGDTLYDIAERYNSTVETLMNLNRLDTTSFIHPGDVLLIPLESEESEAEESSSPASGLNDGARH